MRIALGSDESTGLTDHIIKYLQDKGHTVELVGALRPGEEKLWPYVGYFVAEKVRSGECETGIACCWTGTGVCIAANKLPGARAALCWDAPTARGARRWDDANILALSLRSTSPAVAEEIIEAWLAPVSEEERDEEDRRGIQALFDVENEGITGFKWQWMKDE
jgi:ribose 5-phosphate isomerase B